MSDEYFTPLENDFRARRTHIAMLFAIARADGRHHVNEDKMIREIAERLHISGEELYDIRTNPQNYAIHIPANEEERLMYLYHFLFMMGIDGKVDDDEKKLIKELGMRLGNHPKMVHEMIETMAAHLNEPLPADALKNILRKYMN